MQAILDLSFPYISKITTNLRHESVDNQVGGAGAKMLVRGFS